MIFRSKIKKILFFGACVFHRNHDSKVVYYHDVGTQYTNMGTDLDLMKKHFDIIRKSGYSIVPKIDNRCGEVMICFDDGWAGIYDYKDFFVEQNISPTIFIAIDLIGVKNHLTKEQIKELENLGFKFQCHTWSHRSLTLFNDEELEHELKDSKAELEKLFDHPFTDICYPQGRFSKHIYDLCKKYGYKSQYSSIHGGYYDLEDKGVICRVCAQFSSPVELKMMLNGTSRLFRKHLIKQHVIGAI